MSEAVWQQLPAALKRFIKWNVVCDGRWMS
jgi:hypothetical protein